MEMFKADITAYFEDGSIGAKVIFASTLGRVMDDAEYFISSLILRSRDAGNPVVKHKVIGGEA